MCYVFQSLVGRLRTLDKAVADEFRAAFQSLVGRLRTYWKDIERRLKSAFQSLVGRLRTWREFAVDNGTVAVSIPRR